MSEMNKSMLYHVYIGPSASNNAKIILPSFIEHGVPLKYSVVSVSGQLSNNDPTVNIAEPATIHCKQLSTEDVFYQDLRGNIWNNVLEYTVFNSQIANNPLNAVINDNSVNFYLPNALKDNYTMTFEVRDKYGELMSNNLKFCALTMEIYKSDH